MKYNSTNAAIALAILVVVVLGCKTMTEGKPAAEKAITRFHQMLAEEQYSRIYADSSEMMKEATTEEDLTKIFKLVNRKLGRVRSTSNQNWEVGNYNLTSTVTLIQNTEFEKGKGTEQFVFVVDGTEAKLAGYHINSLDLFSE